MNIVKVWSNCSTLFLFRHKKHVIKNMHLSCNERYLYQAMQGVLPIQQTLTKNVVNSPFTQKLSILKLLLYLLMPNSKNHISVTYFYYFHIYKATALTKRLKEWFNFPVINKKILAKKCMQLWMLCHCIRLSKQWHSKCDS